MKRLLLLAFALAVSACGGEVPQPPSQPPVAVLEPLPETIGVFEVVDLLAINTTDPDTPRAELLFIWTLVSAPNGSNVKIIVEKPDRARILGDRVGVFEIELCVSDETATDCVEDSFEVLP